MSIHRIFMKIGRSTSHSFCIALFLLVCSAISAQTEQPRVRNIVLVHGAWADGSGWKGVYDILVKDGYTVSIIQEPETSFKEDVAATRRTLSLQDGPCILSVTATGEPWCGSWDGSGLLEAFRLFDLALD